MCGRYAILEEETVQEMREIINQVNKQYANRVGLVSHGEVAPSRTAPILRHEDGKVKLDVMKWGFPRWGPSTSLIINARSETVLEKKMFREAFLLRRIVVPASGFYEWDHRQAGRRDKYYFSLREQVIYMAGVYSLFPVEDNAWQACFVILTCPAAEPVAELHDRMPLILPKSDVRTWLDPQTEAAPLLHVPQQQLAGVLCQNT